MNIGELVPFAIFAMVVAIVWIESREKVAKARLRADVQRDMFAKFSTGTELTEFLNSGGAELFKEPADDAAVKAKKRIVNFIVFGILSGAFGGALWFSGEFEGGGIFLAIGAGLLLCGPITYFLARKLDLVRQ